MEFLAALLQTTVKMIFIGVIGFGGIKFGKHLRLRKISKESALEAAKETNE